MLQQNESKWEGFYSFISTFHSAVQAKSGSSRKSICPLKDQSFDGLRKIISH